MLEFKWDEKKMSPIAESMEFDLRRLAQERRIVLSFWVEAGRGGY